MLSYFGIVPNDHILDVPNAALGLIYYIVWLLLLKLPPASLPHKTLLIFVLACLAMSSSVFLAIQLMILKELCILCISTHVINIRLWWSAFSTFRGGDSSHKTKATGGKAKVKRV